MTNLISTNIAMATIAGWMIADANALLDSMDLAYVPRIKPKDIRVLVPIDVTRNYGGVIKTEWLHVAYDASGKIRNMVRLTNGFEIYASPEEDALIATNKSLIDEKQAYQMATNWLRMAGVDITAVEKRVPAKTTQLQVVNGPLLPMFEIKWLDIITNNVAGKNIEVNIYGGTPELTSFHIGINLDQFVTRPSIFSATNLLTLKTNSQPVVFVPAQPGDDPKKKKK